MNYTPPLSKPENQQPNIVERLEELLYSLESAQQHTADDGGIKSDAYSDLDNAVGIVGEILTMIDGR